MNNLRKRVLASMAVLGCLAGESLAGELQPPVRLLAGGKPIDVQRSGHSAPFAGDFDGDGLIDLLVGEFYEGRLRVFRNVGSHEKPKFETHQWFEAGGQLGRVPTG